MSWANAGPSGPASFSAPGSTNSGLGQRLARARYAHTISAVFDAELSASTPPGVLFLLEVRHQAVVRGGHAHRQLGRGLLLLRTARVHVGVVLAHQLAIRRLDLRHVGAELEIEDAVPLEQLGLVAAGPRRPCTVAARTRRRARRRTGARAARRTRAARRLLLH